MAAEMSKSDKRYGGGKPEPKKEAEPHDKKPDGAGEGESDKKAEGEPMADKQDDGKAGMMKDMMKRHEKEHRDLHGQHRDAMRDMHGRHEAEMGQMHANMMGGAQGDMGQTEGAAPAAEPME